MGEQGLRVGGHTYLMSGARLLTTPTTSLGNNSLTIDHKFTLRNQGRKRTAIVGYSWNLSGWYNTSSVANYDLKIGGSVVEQAPNYKETYFNLPYSIVWTNTALSAIVNTHAEVLTFPQPFLVKNAVVTIRFIQNLNTQALLLRAEVWICDAYLVDGFGDFSISTILHKGKRRSAQKGQTRIAKGGLGGVRY